VDSYEEGKVSGRGERRWCQNWTEESKGGGPFKIDERVTLLILIETILGEAKEMGAD